MSNPGTKLLPRNPAGSSLTPTCPGRCFVLKVSTTKFHSKKQTAYYTTGSLGVNDSGLPMGLLGNNWDWTYHSTNVIGQFVACTGILLQVSRYEI